MKKQIYFLVSLFALIGFSVNVMGQSGTGIAPAAGTTHEYSVTGNSGSNFEWWITDGSGTTQAQNGDFVLAIHTTGDGGTVTGNIFSGTTANFGYRLKITWKSISTGKTYYLHVKETNATTTCNNEKVLEIKPINTFDLAVINVTKLSDANIASATDVSGAQTSQLCADGDVVVTLGTTPSYDFRTTVTKFKIYPKSIATGTGWNFDWTSSISSTGTVASTTFANNLGTAVGITPGATTPLISVDGTVPYIVATVTVNNIDETAKTVTMALTNIKDANGNSDITGDSNDTATHEILARPSTSGITGL